MNQKGFILTAFLCMIFVYAELRRKYYSDYWYLSGGETIEQAIYKGYGLKFERRKYYSDYWYLSGDETLEQALYKDYGLKIENGKLLWYDPRVPNHPTRRLMYNETIDKYLKEYRLKKRPYTPMVISNAIILFDPKHYYYSRQEKKHIVIVEDRFLFGPRVTKSKRRFFYRFTKKKELEFSEDKKTWEKVKVELVYEDFTLEKDPPRDEDDPNDTSSILFKLRISCKWFDEVFCRAEPSL